MRDAPRLDHDVLDLDAVAAVDRAVGAPWPVDREMGARLAPPGAIEAGDQHLDVLHPVALGDEDDVAGSDDDEVLDAERRDHVLFGT
jgi:hypothetical protein